MSSQPATEEMARLPQCSGSIDAKGRPGPTTDSVLEVRFDWFGLGPDPPFWQCINMSGPQRSASPDTDSSGTDDSGAPPPWDDPITMSGVKYQGPVTILEMVDPEPGPSLEDQENALPKRDKIIQICQSDEMFTWIHALATILVINEKAVIGGLKVSEQLRVWQDTIRVLKTPPWIFAH